MTVQTNNRRLRHAPPDPRVRRIVLTDADYLLFEVLERHGPLPSSYLYEFTRHLRKDRTYLQNRLTEFYNGDAQGGLLVRPPQQFAAYEARYQHLVYDLTTRARHLLAERRTYRPHAIVRSDPFVHRLMCACIGATFELTAAANGMRYISFEEILSRSGRQSPSKGNPLALPCPGNQTFIPDLLFGLEYPGAGYRFFTVESDRNTESIERRNLRQSAFGRKLTAYAAALDARSYRLAWGVPNLHVLTVTTNAVHSDNILQFVRDNIAPQHHAYFAVTLTTTFGTDWRVPKEPLSHLLLSPWRTAAGVRDLSRA